jgi:hypothetical protein
MGLAEVEALASCGVEALVSCRRLRRPDGSAYTINVEYNQLDPLLRSTSEFAQGDAPDPGLLLAISLLPNMIFQVVASPSRRGQA